MNHRTAQAFLIVGVLAACAVAILIRESPPEVSGTSPDMAAVFAANPDKEQAKQDAVALGLMLNELAALVEWDGAAATPRINSGAKVEDVRITLRSYRFFGRQLSQTYPDLGKAFESAASRISGDDPTVTLTPEKRKEWVELFKSFGAACHHAGK